MNDSTREMPKAKKPINKEQSARFKKAARQLSCDETPGALDRAFGKINPGREPSSSAKHKAFADSRKSE